MVTKKQIRAFEKRRDAGDAMFTHAEKGLEMTFHSGPFQDDKVTYLRIMLRVVARTFAKIVAPESADLLCRYAAEEFVGAFKNALEERRKAGMN